MLGNKKLKLLEDLVKNLMDNVDVLFAKVDLLAREVEDIKLKFINKRSDKKNNG